MAFVAFQDLGSTSFSFKFLMFNSLYTHPSSTPCGRIPFACRISTLLVWIRAGSMWHPQSGLFDECLSIWWLFTKVRVEFREPNRGSGQTTPGSPYHPRAWGTRGESSDSDLARITPWTGPPDGSCDLCSKSLITRQEAKGLNIPAPFSIHPPISCWKLTRPSKKPEETEAYGYCPYR